MIVFRVSVSQISLLGEMMLKTKILGYHRTSLVVAMGLVTSQEELTLQSGLVIEDICHPISITGSVRQTG